MKVNYLSIRIRDGPQRTVDRKSVDIYYANERPCVRSRTSEAIVYLASEDSSRTAVSYW